MPVAINSNNNLGAWGHWVLLEHSLDAMGTSSSVRHRGVIMNFSIFRAERDVCYRELGV